MYIVVILLGTSVGATTSAEASPFHSWDFLCGAVRTYAVLINRFLYSEYCHKYTCGNCRADNTGNVRSHRVHKMYIVVILLGTSVGATTSAEAFLKWDTLKIVALGLIAFGLGTAAGVMFGKVMYHPSLLRGNPLRFTPGIFSAALSGHMLF